MSCSHAAASRSPASGPGDGLRVRARAATPWTWDQRRGRASARRGRARPSAQAASICIEFTLVSLAGTFTDAACRLETSETSLLPRASHTEQSWCRLAAVKAHARDSCCVVAGEAVIHLEHGARQATPVHRSDDHLALEDSEEQQFFQDVGGA